MNIRLIEQTKKTNIKGPICKLVGGKKNYWNRCKPVILRQDALEYMQEVKRYLPEEDVSEFELEIAKNLFLQGQEPRAIVRQLISAGCCRF